MKSGRYIGVMSGTSLDGVDVVLAAIDERMVAQQASLTWPIPISLKEDILSICQGQQLTLSQLGQLDVRLGALFADAVQALMQKKIFDRRMWLPSDAMVRPSGMSRLVMRRIRCKSVITTRLWRRRASRSSAISVVAILRLAARGTAGAGVPSGATGTPFRTPDGAEYRRNCQRVNAHSRAACPRLRYRSR